MKKILCLVSFLIFSILIAGATYSGDTQVVSMKLEELIKESEELSKESDKLIKSAEKLLADKEAYSVLLFNVCNQVFAEEGASDELHSRAWEGLKLIANDTAVKKSEELERLLRIDILSLPQDERRRIVIELFNSMIGASK